MEGFNIFDSNVIFEASDVLVEDTETGVKYKMYKKDDIAIILEMEKKVDFKTINKSLIDSLVESLNKKVKINRRYSLWKDGREYLTHGLAVNANTLDIYVVYQALYGDKIYYARPYHLFTSEVDEGRRSKDNLTGQKYRFELIKEDND